MTIRKLANLALNHLEFKLVAPRPRSVPSYMKIEATPLCHLSCGGCVHVSKDHKKSLGNKMHLTVESVAKIIEPVKDDIIGISLSYSGEPLLNKSIVDVVEFIHARNICTFFSTNLSVPMSDIQAEALVASGLDRMQISLDGNSPETYRKYRVGGSFDLVVANVRKLADAKRRQGRRVPELVWKFVIFDHNAHETDAASKTFKTKGFDSLEFVLNYDGETALAQARDANAKLVHNRKACFWPWNTATIAWDGTVQACCKQINSISLGNAVTSGFRAVWQGAEYAKLRRSFRKKQYGQGMHEVCRKCIGIGPVQTGQDSTVSSP